MKVEWPCFVPNDITHFPEQPYLAYTCEKLAAVPTLCRHSLLMVAALHEVEAIVPRAGHPETEDQRCFSKALEQAPRPCFTYPNHSKILGEEGRGLAGDGFPVAYSRGARLGSNVQSGQHRYTAVLLLCCCVVLAFPRGERYPTKFVKICRRCSEGVFHDTLPEA